MTVELSTLDLWIMTNLKPDKKFMVLHNGDTYSNNFFYMFDFLMMVLGDAFNNNQYKDLIFAMSNMRIGDKAILPKEIILKAI